MQQGLDTPYNVISLIDSITTARIICTGAVIDRIMRGKYRITESTQNHTSPGPYSVKDPHICSTTAPIFGNIFDSVLIEWLLTAFWSNYKENWKGLLHAA